MKNKILRNIILVFTMLFLQSFVSGINGSGKCKGDVEYQKAVKILGNFRLIKDYRVTLSGGKEKNPPTLSFPISLTSGLRYKFVSMNNTSNKTKMIMQIFINQKKEMMIATTYNKKSKKHYPTIEFECRTSGTYFLFFTFDAAIKGCGVGLFSVKK